MFIKIFYSFGFGKRFLRIYIKIIEAFHTEVKGGKYLKSVECRALKGFICFSDRRIL